MTLLRRHSSRVVALVFGLGGPVMGLVAAQLAYSLDQQRASTACADYFSGRAAEFAHEMQETVDDLQHLRSLLLVSDHVSREQFRVFARELAARRPAVVALEWIPRVGAEVRNAHERQARAEGVADYQIRVQASGGGTLPAPPKAEYYPVFYVEPFEPNRQALGFDISSEPASRRALERAANTREPSLTDPVDLPQLTGSDQGFMLLLPVFATPEFRPGAPGGHADGFVALVMRIHDVFNLVLDTGATHGPAAMRFELSDTDVRGRTVVLERSPDGNQSPSYKDWRFIEQFNVGGQLWELAGRPTSAYVSSHLTRQPFGLGIAVFLFWELLGGLALSLVRHARDVAFQKQTRLFETSLRSLTEGVVVADASGRFLLFNDAAETVLGMGSRDVGVPEWSATYGCFYPDGQTPFPSEQLPLARALRGERCTEEVFIRNHNIPEGVRISINGTPLRDQQGAPDGGIVVFRDITATRLAEERLRASIKQLEDLSYAVDQAALVAMTDRAGTIIYANAKFSEVSGYSKEELLGQNHRILNSGFHPTAFFQDLWRTISSGGVWRGRICNRARDGSRFWVDTTIVPLVADGKPERYLALRTDITEQMRQEGELVRLSNAVQQTADAIIITNRDGIIEYVNPAFEATTGYSRDEAIGQTPRILRSGKQSPEYYERLWKTIASGEVFRGSPVNRRKNGELYHAEQTITPIKDSEGRVVHFVSVLKDATDRIRIEQQEIEMQYASDVQRRLYPVAAPVVPGFDIAAASFPALATCGDYFDYLPLPNGAIGVVIGDVSGHGLGPALIMAEARAYLRFLSKSSADPGEVLTAMNSALHEDLDENRYVALILAQVDPSARRMVYANAGHTSAYHLDRRGAVKAVMESCGPPLGIMPSMVYTVTENPPLEEGDIVVFLTDGVTETEDVAGNYFGAGAAIDVIRAHLDDSAQALIQHLQQATRDFARGAPQQDDVTVVVCKVGPAPGDAEG